MNIHEFARKDRGDIYRQVHNWAIVYTLDQYKDDHSVANPAKRLLFRMLKKGVAKKIQDTSELETNDMVCYRGELWKVPKYKPVETETISAREKLRNKYVEQTKRLFLDTFINPRIYVENLKIEASDVEPTYEHTWKRTINLTINPSWYGIAKHTCDGYMPVVKLTNEPNEGRYRVQKVKCWDLSKMRARQGPPEFEIKYLATLDDKTAGIGDTVNLAIMKVNNKLMKTTRNML